MSTQMSISSKRGTSNYLHFMIYLQSIVLENLAYPFSKPNILDIKLGTVLYDEFATPEKRQRMENTARVTTSLETGVRLTGFQVCSQLIYISNIVSYFEQRYMITTPPSLLSPQKRTANPSKSPIFQMA